MAARDVSEPTAKQKAAKQTRLRLILLIAIGAVLVGTFWLKGEMGRRESASSRLDDPAHRARTALAEADAAVINKDLATVWTKLGRARAALDDGLALRPTDVALQRSRVVVMRRLANVAQELGRPEAPGLFEEALTHARALFDQSPHDQRGRVDLLKAARELGAHRVARKTPGAAASALTGAAEAVEAAHAVLPAEAKVRGLLASTWTDAAEAHAANAAKADARAALLKASGHAESATRGGDDPVAALATAAGLVGRAAQVAWQLELPEALDLARRSVALLEQQRGLTPENRSFDVSLAQWLGRVGDLQAKADRPKAAEESYRQAITIRRGLVDRFAEDELKADLVRAINRLGAFHSAAGRNEAALAAYAEAVELARGLSRHTRVLIIALGNYAHVLGRIDRMVESKKAAAEAYTLAAARAEADGATRRARIDAAIAGLRHARLLRAKPRPQRREARRVARAERERLVGLPGERSSVMKQALEGFDSLLAELGG